MDENGHAVIEDGKPVYVHDDGKDVPFDALQATNKIATLNEENAGRRKKNEEFETVLKTYAVEGEDGKPALLDPKIALETPGDHLGLLGMKERAEGMGAKLVVNSSPKSGTEIELNLQNPEYLDGQI